MPELPEVETIVRGLRGEIVNRIIQSVIVRDDTVIAVPDKKSFKNELSNRRIKKIRRRGKYIIIELSKNKNLVVHLRMTGKLLIKNKSATYDKHTHVIFQLDNDCELRFNNIRKFGRLYLFDDTQWHKAGSLDSLGPEPLAADFTLEKFKKLFKNRKGLLKPLLLNQKFIAVLGNIYADEALFIAAISPERKANTLDDQELEKLYYAIKTVLKKAIKFCGTSFSDYVNSKGEMGSFQNLLNVYQKEGEKCPCCGSEIQKKKIAGRSSHFCESCQQ